MEGKEAGETVSVVIPPDEAYGPRHGELILAVPRSDLPAQITPKVGLRLRLTLDDGELEAIISRVSGEEVELDGNHPLAGETLRFQIEILEIKAG